MCIVAKCFLRSQCGTALVVLLSAKAMAFVECYTIEDSVDS